MKKITYLYGGAPAKLDWNEKNEILAKSEADNSKYAIVDEVVEETEPMSQAQRIAELEEALHLLLSGVTE